MEDRHCQRSKHVPYSRLLFLQSTLINCLIIKLLKTPKNEAASFLRCLSQQLIDDSSILMPFNVLMSVGVKSRAA